MPKPTPLMAILATGLLVASTAATVAQDEAPADPMAPAAFEWRWTDATLEADDPRASGEMTIVEGPVAETDSNVIATYQTRLVNDGGAWSGSGREIGAWATDPSGGDWQDSEFDSFWELGVAMWELEGEGGYDGLRLFLFTEYEYAEEVEGGSIRAPHPISWGIILPADAGPPVLDMATG